jgi:APA family basic amino acid/polyamine antiporter
MRGAGKIFFAYIGFDAVSTAAQEAKNPQKDMPLGILGSLTICTVLYIVTSWLLTGVISYTRLNVGAPIALGMAETGVSWGEFLVLIGTIMGLSTVMLVMLLGQSRVFFSMSRDGLLPAWAGAVHPRFRTPWISSIVVGAFVAFLPAILPIGILDEMTSIGTLLAFTIVCAGVWVLRVRRPDLHRPFKTPLVPLVPILGIVSALALMLFLPLATWIRLVIWLIIGMGIYLSYGRKNSRVQQYLAANAKVSAAKQ